MIIIITLIRSFCVNKFPKKVFLLLWEIVMIRLLVPFEITSVTSAFNLLDINREISVQSGYLSEISEESLIFPEINISDEKKNISVIHIVRVAGTVLCMFCFTSVYFICYKKFRSSWVLTNEYAINYINKQKLKRKIRVCMSEKVSSPLTYGIFHPVILLPDIIDLNNINDLNYVLAHELIHIKRFDMIRKIIAVITVCVHWFNPAVWLFFLLINKDIELVCDETVIKSGGKDTRAAYARALINIEENRGGLGTLYNNFNKNSIEERINAIMKTKKITFFASITAAVLVITVTAAFMTSATPKALENSESDFISDDQYIEINDEISGNISEETTEKEAVVLPNKIDLPQSESLSGNEAQELLSRLFDEDFKNPLDDMSDITYSGGFEIKADKDKDIYSMSNGVVICSNYDYRFGKFIVIDYGSDNLILYGNCDKIAVNDGDIVNSGDIIASVGVSGFTEYPRLLIYKLTT